MRISHLFIAISLTISIALPVIAEDTSQREFATHLFNQKDYYRTITEAKRYLFFNPEGPSSEEMEILIGDAYIAGGDLKQGVAEYNAFISRHENSNRSPEIEYKIAKVMISEHEEFILRNMIK
jgi:TolA-binding protein